MKKNFLVIGGTGGLGKAVVEKFELEGCNVVTASRKPVDFDQRLHMQVDVCSVESLKSAKKILLQNNIELHGVINLAGIASMNLLLTTPFSTVEKIIQTNLLGSIYATQIFAPLIIKAGGGSITNFSTIAVNLDLAGEAIYVASKAGVESFSRVAARELSAFGVRVNCIAPGPVQTSLIAGVPSHKILEIVNRQIQKTMKNEVDVADTTWLIAGHKDASSITGEVINVGGA